MIVVADTSVLLNLCCVGQEELLPQLFGVIVIPPEVAGEFERLSRDAPRFRGLKLPSWIRQQSAREIPVLVREAAGLDLGESAALSLAVEIQADAILIDERKGHRAALELGLKTVGVLGILVQAKRNGLVPNIGYFLERLERQAGFWMAPGVRRQILFLAGE